MHSPRSTPANPQNVIIAVTLAALASLFAWASPPAAAQDALGLEPYMVYVAHDEVYTRCGPSDDYYRADPLRHGQELEVYVETADGWLGIRPPENSFCWIPAAAIELSGSDDTGEVIEDRSVSWIGTHLGRARQYRWQVQLAEGESVTIIGRSERDGPDGPQLWYRIVPPSGEFRWIHRDQTVNSTEALVATARRQQPTPSPTVEFKPVERRPIHARTAELETEASSTDSALATHSRDRSNSSRRADRDATISPMAEHEIPSFRPAPQSADADRPSSEPSSLASLLAGEVIGSGLSEAWQSGVARQTAPQPTTSIAPPQPFASAASPASASIANASIVGQPRLVEIGTGIDAAAPAAGESAGDENWVSGAARSQAVAQVSGIRPLPAQSLAPPSSNRQRQEISPAQLAEIENEVRGADVEKLQIILSHLMANEASSWEITPVINEAARLARTTTDEVTAGRARLIAERAEQYQRVAERRQDSGATSSQSLLVIPASRAGSLSLPAPERSSEPGHSSAGLTVAQSPANLQPFTADSPASPQGTSGSESPAFTESGFLVQVYSARTNSPPYALTDHGGNTVAYVTPAPGINLRNHLNSRIQVSGNRGFLAGLNTPHILVTKAVRSRD